MLATAIYPTATCGAPHALHAITVSNCGRICIGRRKINLSTVFAGQNVGIKQLSDKAALVSFMQYDLGFFDHETDRVTGAETPIGAKVTYVPGTVRYLCDRNEPVDSGGKGGTRTLDPGIMSAVL